MTHVLEVLKGYALTPVVGMPLYALVIMIALPVLNEIVNRHQKITAQSLLQLLGNAIKSTPLYAVPIVKQVADILGTPKVAVEMPPPLPPPPSMLLPFLLGVSLLGLGIAASGCTPGGKALGACELGQLPQVLQSVIAKVAAIVAQPSGWENDLEQLGIQVGPGQLSCVEQAIATALEPSAASPDTPTKSLMRSRLQAHAAKHPHACRPITLSRAELSLVRW